MTYKQFLKKAEAARNTGRAALPDGEEIRRFDGRFGEEYAAYSKDGQCIDISSSPEGLAYLFYD